MNPNIDTAKVNGNVWRRRTGWIAVSAAGLAGVLIGAATMVLGPLSESVWHRQGGRGGHTPVSGSFHSGGTEYVVARLLSEIDATSEQAAAVEKIVGSLMTDLDPIVEDHRGRHKAFSRIFASEQFDQAALETFRAEEVRMLEQASNLIADALVAVGEILDTDQRKALSEAFTHVHGQRRSRRRQSRGDL